MLEANKSFKDVAIALYGERVRLARKDGQIDNASLHAGEPMYFYCHDCGILVAKLPEEYIFPPPRRCCECNGLAKNGFMDEAKKSIS